ncbi:MAG: YXWGXW repeat-containing protein, partial [Planctomycetales bacterium]|nr:YXWGXW repeat-containing protein [Planctomycetales bacterium]
MNGPSRPKIVGAALVAGWLLFNPANVAFGQPPVAAPPNDLPPGVGYENIDVLTRGPLHEAFAEQFTDEPTAGLIVNRQPPEPIDEVPPDYRPEGANVEWIPGYWGWDVENEDFIWITGIWRDVPPRQRFIPGYWTRVDNGWQWISGFWTLEQTSQLEYLPYPPEAVDSAPSSEPPTTDHFWVPGQWSYVNQQYRWRAGYWSVGYDDWVWIPDRYVWTPYGCVFRPGYWDYVLTSRGTVFCPIRPRVVTAGFRFQPTYVVDTGVSLLVNLFVQPRYHHYCFGDYYGDTYVARNIYPWVSYHTVSRRYDPLYSYYRYQYRESSYVQRIARWHDYFRDHRELRPPRDLAGQVRMATRVNGQYADYITRAHSLRALADRPGDHHRYSRLDRDDLVRVERYASPLREISRERSTWETLHRGEFDRGRTDGVDRRPDFARDAREPRDRDDRRN